MISCAVTPQLVCAFVFAYAKSRFSHYAAHLVYPQSTIPEFANCTFSDNDTDQKDDDADHVEFKETLAETSLPWNDSSHEPSPTHFSDSFPNDEPVIAHVPSWVNNLSYSHITETGSPYVSPQTTLIPKREDNHRPVFSLFSDIEQKLQPLKNVCEQFPAPWIEDVGGANPQVSPMVTESGEKSCDFLNHDHMTPAPDHHHVIMPTNELLDEKEGSGSHKDLPHTLSEVASAPDIQHWKPIKVRSHNNYHNNFHRLQSESVLSELAFQEKVKNRVQQWLIHADSDAENDADTEDVEENGIDVVTDDDVESIELELDLAMHSKIAMQSARASVKSKH